MQGVELSVVRHEVSRVRCQVSGKRRLAIADCGTVPRHGISLIEVLAAIGVLSIGLLGLAALLPIGLYTIGEATKADRAGNCGRAALRDVIVRRMLDSNYWTGNYGTSQAFLIDPLGVTASPPLGNFGNGATVVPRISLGTRDSVGKLTPYSAGLANQIFMATDDLNVPMPEDMKPAQPVGRPLNMGATGTMQPLDYAGAYTWFLSVVPVPNNPTRFTVSVVVCFQRAFPAAPQTGERAVAVNTFFDKVKVNNTMVALGGGSVQLARPINDTQADSTASPPTVTGINLKEDDWVALCNKDGLCRWYRIAQIGDDSSYLTLVGPDWMPDPNQPDKLVAVGRSVLGVYTTTVDLDTDPTWKN
jgi:hypothetical protein